MADGATAQHDSLTAGRPLPTVGGAYAWYVLVVLMVVYIFNFIDRSILTILGKYIQQDMGLSDGQLGLLSGTVFALFYGLFGLALGRLADSWRRTWTIALGLTMWSGMTALSGFASNFGQLAAARVGVGVGEASASPAAYSLIGDWFPRSMRATALSVYSSGIFIGAGLSFMISGVVVDGWNKTYPHGTGAPLALVGWQAAFLIIGIPGLLLALIVLTLREPPRGLADGLIVALPAGRHPLVRTIAELGTVLPPFPLFTLRRAGASAATLRRNRLALAIAAAAAVVMTVATDALVPAVKLKIIAQVGPVGVTSNTIQWAAMAIGLYGVFSWSQALHTRDRPLHALVWGTPTFLYTAAAGTLISFNSYAIGAWIFIYASRALGAQPGTAGLLLGLGSAVGGWIGTTAGGLIGDAWRRRDATGRLKLSLLASAIPLPIALFALSTHQLSKVYICYFLVILIGTAWLGGITATMQDLVLPRMRGTAGAMFFMGTTLIGLGNGPYFVGLVSDAIGSLRVALFAAYAVVPIAWFCIWRAMRGLPLAEASRVYRARAAGEPI